MTTRRSAASRARRLSRRRASPKRREGWRGRIRSVGGSDRVRLGSPPAARTRASLAHTPMAQTRCSWSRSGREDGAGQARRRAGSWAGGIGAIVRRLPLRTGSDPTLRERTRADRCCSCSASCACRRQPARAASHAVAANGRPRSRARVGAGRPNADMPEVHRVELPRLALGFRSVRPPSRAFPASTTRTLRSRPRCPRSAARRRVAPAAGGSTRRRSDASPPTGSSGGPPAQAPGAGTAAKRACLRRRLLPSGGTISGSSSASPGPGPAEREPGGDLSDQLLGRGRSVAQGGEDVYIDAVEPSDGWRLFSEEHPTLFVSDHRGPLVRQHLHELPHRAAPGRARRVPRALSATVKPFFLTRDPRWRAR